MPFVPGSSHQVTPLAVYYSFQGSAAGRGITFRATYCATHLLALLAACLNGAVLRCWQRPCMAEKAEPLIVCHVSFQRCRKHDFRGGVSPERGAAASPRHAAACWMIASKREATQRSPGKAGTW